jgi:hypothetical protein
VNEMIERCSKNRKWLKSVTGLTEQDLEATIEEGFPVVYVFEVFTKAHGDAIKIATFKEVLPDDYMQKRFTNSKVGGTLTHNVVCEVDLR